MFKAEHAQARYRERFAAEMAYDHACNALDGSWEAFAKWRDSIYPPLGEEVVCVEHPVAVAVEPTQEAVASFNLRQLELRGAYIAGYVESLPEHRSEGVEKAARRFPLKRLRRPQVAGSIQGLDASVAGELVFLTKANGHQVHLSREALLAALALLDEQPRVEDVPLEEEEG